MEEADATIVLDLPELEPVGDVFQCFLQFLNLLPLFLKSFCHWLGQIWGYSCRLAAECDGPSVVGGGRLLKAEIFFCRILGLGCVGDCHPFTANSILVLVVWLYESEASFRDIEKTLFLKLGQRIHRRIVYYSASSLNFRRSAFIDPGLPIIASSLSRPVYGIDPVILFIIPPFRTQMLQLVIDNLRMVGRLI